MTFDELAVYLTAPDLSDFVARLRTEKASGTEAFRVPAPAIIRSFLEETVKEGDARFLNLPDSQRNSAQLESFLRETVLGKTL
jgi:hypothetical protein